MHPHHDPLTTPPVEQGAVQGDRTVDLAPDEERTVELREEQLVAHKEQRQVGEVSVRTEVEQVPAALEVEAVREEVVVEHEPVGQPVSERQQPWEQDGELIVPVYEEQLVVTKRLVLRERLHVRRVSTRERQLFQDTVKRDRLIVDDPQQTGAVHEVYPTVAPGEEAADNAEVDDAHDDGNLLTRLVTKALE